MSKDSEKFVLGTQSIVNPRTQRKHRREFWWQILIPFLVLASVIIGAAYYLLSAFPATIPNLAQIGTMVLILPIIFIGAFGFLIAILLIYGLAIINKVLPPNAFWLQQQIMRINNRVKQGADLAAEPILRLGSWASAVKKIFRRFV